MQKLWNKAVLAMLLCFASPGWAQSALGGLQKAKSVGEDIKTGLYALLGTAALIYLVYLAFMAFTEKKTWSDFGWGVVYTSVAGAVISIGAWAWTAFQ